MRSLRIKNAPLAQLEVASALHAEGRKFDPYRVYKAE